MKKRETIQLETTANVKVAFSPTMRGYARIEFVDGCGAPCSLQESSGAPIDSEENWIWFGCEENAKPHHVTGAAGKPRMFLSQSDVATLLPILKRFARTGRILESEKP